MAGKYTSLGQQERVVSSPTKSRQVWDPHKTLNNLADTNKVTLMYVKGNITTDDLASLGAITSSVGFNPRVNISETLMKDKLRVWFASEHIEKWENLKRCRQSNSFVNFANAKD